MLNLVDLLGKKILITGASAGIGKQTAITLNKLGAEVILVSRREDKLREVFSKLEGEGNAFYTADLADINSIEELVKKIVVEQGKLDGMVYAAGVGTSIPMAQFKPEKIQKVFDINCFGFIEIVRQITKKGRFNEGMRIVGISSIAAFQGEKAHLAYSSSKSAMDSAVRCMACELADKGICVNTVAPAMTATDMFNGFKEKYGEDSDTMKTLLKRQYLGIAEPQDIANAIAFLISPAARFITGITLPVDGGRTTS